MVLDWKNEKEFALANGIQESVINGEKHLSFKGSKSLLDWDISVNLDWHDLVFKNFAMLQVRFGDFYNCYFENCQEIEFIGCGLYNCVFKNSHIKENNHIHSKFFDCKFEN